MRLAELALWCRHVLSFLPLPHLRWTVKGMVVSVMPPESCVREPAATMSPLQCATLLCCWKIALHACGDVSLKRTGASSSYTGRGSHPKMANRPMPRRMAIAGTGRQRFRLRRPLVRSGLLKGACR